MEVVSFHHNHANMVQHDTFRKFPRTPMMTSMTNCLKLGQRTFFRDISTDSIGKHPKRCCAYISIRYISFFSGLPFAQLSSVKFRGNSPSSSRCSFLFLLFFLVLNECDQVRRLFPFACFSFFYFLRFLDWMQFYAALPHFSPENERDHSRKGEK